MARFLYRKKLVKVCNSCIFIFKLRKVRMKELNSENQLSSKTPDNPSCL